MKINAAFLIMMMLANMAVPNEVVTEYVPSELDCNGSDFTILHSADYTILPDEMTGAIVDDAQYVARMYTEEMHNVRLCYRVDPDPTRLVWMSILAADPICDVVIDDAVSLSSRAYMGGYMNLNNLPELTLNGVWWNQSLNSQLEVGLEKKLFTAANDISPVNYDAVSCILYDYDVLGDKPLELVREGEWTLDKLLELAKEGGGFVSSVPNAETSLLFGTGADFISVTDETISLAPLTNNMLDAADKIAELFTLGGEKASIAVGSVGNIKQIQYRELSDLLPNIENVRAVPLPKLDANDDYRSPVTEEYELLAIPVTCMDTVKTATVLNAYQYRMYDKVLPARYEESMQSKTMKYDEIGEMIDIMRDSLTIDRRIQYNCASFNSSAIADAIENGNLASSFVMHEAKMQKLLDKCLHSYGECMY